MHYDASRSRVWVLKTPMPLALGFLAINSSHSAISFTYSWDRRAMMFMLLEFSSLTCAGWILMMDRDITFSLRHSEEGFYFSILAHIAIRYSLLRTDFNPAVLLRWLASGHPDFYTKNLDLRMFSSDEGDIFLGTFNHVVKRGPLTVSIFPSGSVAKI